MQIALDMALRIAPILLGILAAALLAGCMDADPFRRAYRRIAGEYELYKAESYNYYLLRDGYKEDGHGYGGGAVRNIGWTENHIFMELWPGGGRPPGWYVIYLKTDKITGPLTGEEFTRRFPRAVINNAGAAWLKLKE